MYTVRELQVPSSPRPDVCAQSGRAPRECSAPSLLRVSATGPLFTDLLLYPRRLVLTPLPPASACIDRIGSFTASSTYQAAQHRDYKPVFAVVKRACDEGRASAGGRLQSRLSTYIANKIKRVLL